MDFLDEVKEELRQEQMVRFFKKYGKLIGLIIGGVILASACFTWFTQYQFNKRAKDGLAYFQANEQVKQNPKSKTALTAYENISEKGTKGYKLLANFQKASLLIEQGEAKKAFGIYENMFASSQDAAFRDLAGLYAAHIALDMPEYASKETMQSRLATLSQKGKPFQLLAMELQLAYAITHKEYDKAEQIYNEIMTLPNLKPSVQRRIQALAPNRIEHIKKQQEQEG